MKNGVRLADAEIYRDSEYLKKPKEIWKYIFSLFSNKVNKLDTPVSVLDIGCASGEFLHFLRERNENNNEYYGIDSVQSLIDEAKKKVKGVNFCNKSVLEPPYFDDKKFDFVFCMGVVSIFDDIVTFLNSILTATRKGTVIYLSSFFNPYPIDAIIRYRRSDVNVPNDYVWRTGWNRFSIQTVENILKPLTEKIVWHEHKMPFSLEKQGDHMRSWTIGTERDQFQRINGLLMLTTAYIAEITI